VSGENEARVLQRLVQYADAAIARQRTTVEDDVAVVRANVGVQCRLFGRREGGLPTRCPAEG
jgi:hypothetical protein